MVAGLVACTGLVLPAPATAADSGCGDSNHASLVVTTIPATTVSCLDWEELTKHQDVSGRTYELPDPVKIEAGVSMNTLLTLLDVPVGRDQVRTTAVRGPNGTPAGLSSRTNDFAPQWEDTFFEGPPVFSTQDSGTSLRYITPRRRGSDAAGVEVGSGDGGVLRMVVHTAGFVLRPVLGLTTSSAGEFVSFRLSVDDPDVRESLTVETNFGDGSPPAEPLQIARSREATFAHRFPRDTYTHRYLVTVHVSGDADSGGVATLDVTVPAKAPPPPTSTPATVGPSNGAGGRNAPVYAPPTGSGPEPTGDVSGDPAATRNGPGGVPTGPSGATSRSSTASGTARPSGVRVAGYALPAPDAFEVNPARRRPATAARSSVVGHDFPTWGVVTVVVVIGLGLLGAVSERRRPSRRPRRAMQ